MFQLYLTIHFVRCNRSGQLLADTRSVFTLVVGLLLLFHSTIVAAVNTNDIRHTPAHLQTHIDVTDAVHLLSRTGIGSSPQDVLRYTDMTREEAIDKLLAEIRTTPFIPMPLWTHEPAPHYAARGSMQINQQRAFNRQRDAELGQLRRWWISEMVQTPSPQTERLVLFWHNHFVSAYSAINRQSTSMARQNQLFREHASGNFGDFVKAVLRDPAMLDYLDNRSNRKQAPNENLARELLELFTMGEGNYSESDVKNAARALTGTTVAPRHDMRFQFVANNHDYGEKTLFGQTGNFGADELVDLIMEQPEVAVFITKKFWREYVNSSTISEAAIKSVAEQFRNSDYSVQELLRALLQHEDFWSPQNRLAVIKSPVDLVVGTLRSRGLGGDHAAAAVTALAQQGQSLFEPPNVAGWNGGESWITPNNLLSRMEWLKKFAAVAHKTDSSTGAPEAAYGSSANAMNMVPVAKNREERPADDNSGSMSGNSMSGNSMLPDQMYQRDMSGGEESVNQKAADVSSGIQITARMASDDFRGTPQVSIRLLKQKTVVWQSGVVNLKPGRDTVRHGVSTDYSEFLFQNYKFVASENSQAKVAGTVKRNNQLDYDEVQLHFLNDLSDGDGDRNVYIEWISINKDRYFPSDGKQHSQCVPSNPFNAGYLYCKGHVSIPIEADTAEMAENKFSGNELIFDGLRVDQVFLDRAQPLDNVGPNNPSMAFTLAGVSMGKSHWHNLQVQLVNLQGVQYQLVLQRYNCWPDCLNYWPECSNRSEREPYFRSVRIKLEVNTLDSDAKQQRGICHIDDLETDDANMVMAIWRSLPELAEAVKDDRKLSRKKLHKNFNLWRKHFDKAQALAPEQTATHEAPTPDVAKPVIPEVSTNHTQEKDMFTTWVESAESLLNDNTISPGVRALFTPLKRQVSSSDVSALRTLARLDKRGDVQNRRQFRAYLSSPVFQLK